MNEVRLRTCASDAGFAEVESVLAVLQAARRQFAPIPVTIVHEANVPWLVYALLRRTVNNGLPGGAAALRSLQPEQFEEASAFFQERAAYGLSTAPAARTAAVAAVDALYTELQRPLVPVAWVPSPSVGIAASLILLAILPQELPPAEPRLTVTPETLLPPLPEAVAPPPYDKNHPHVAAVVQEVLAQLQLTNDPAVQSRWDNVSGLPSVYGGPCYGVFGQFEGRQAAYVDFLTERCGYPLPQGKSTALQQAVTQLALSAGMIWPTKSFCLICERTNQISMVNRKPHSETGPAITWPGGEALWSLRGRLVFEQVVLSPETLTKSQLAGIPDRDVQELLQRRHRDAVRAASP